MSFEKLKYVSFEELESKSAKEYYEKLCVSIFSKSLTTDESSVQFSLEQKSKNESAFLERTEAFINSFLDEERYEVLVIGYDKHGNEKLEIIDFQPTSKKLIQSLKKENDFKLLFPNSDIIFDLAFDFSFVLYLVRNSPCRDEVLKKIQKSGLHVLN